MYSIEDAKTAIRHPRNIPREINRWYFTRFRSRDYNLSAPNIFDKGWDNLIILDACRYDAFKELIDEYEIEGDLEEEYSRGAATMEFLEANFPERDLSDTVYVTGTSMLYRMTVLEDHFDHNLYDIIDVWTDAEYERGNASPDQMLNATRQAAEKYPNKRLLIHFIQPHCPFIGEFGSEKFGHINDRLWQKQRRGELGASDDDLKRAYYENVEEVLPAVNEAIEELRGKTVVTADHGQLIGERQFPIPIKDYGHPNGIYMDELTKVPWFESNFKNRKRIVKERPKSRYDKDNREEIDEKAKGVLRELGYLHD